MKKAIQKKWVVWFEENGGEYIGSLRIVAHHLEQLSKTKILADGVLIEMDENITKISLLQDNLKEQ